MGGFRFIAVLFVALLLTLTVTAYTEPSKAVQTLTSSELRQLSWSIRRILPRLVDRRHSVRYAAAEELKKMHPEADGIMLANLPDLAFRQQLPLLEVLASRGAKGTAVATVDLALKTKSEYHPRLVRVMQRLPDRGWPALKKRLQKEKKLQGFMRLFVRGEILALFRQQVSEGGYYSGMYDPVIRYGKEALVVLAAVVENGSDIIYGMKDRTLRALRISATRALGESGDQRARPLLKQAAKKLFAGSDLRNACFFALYVLGDKRDAEAVIKSYKSKTLTAPSGWQRVNAFNRLAYAYVMISDHLNAIKAYQFAIDDGKSGRSISSTVRGMLMFSYYNQACAYSQTRRTHSALRAIKAAVASGYGNWEWMFKDRDLKNLWAYGGFKKWISSLRKDSLHGVILPKWEPGQWEPGQWEPGQEG